MAIIGIRIFNIFLLTQAADELHEQEVRKMNDEIQQTTAQLEQTQVLNPVLMQVDCVPIPILPSSLFNKTTISMIVVYLKVTFFLGSYYTNA